MQFEDLLQGMNEWRNIQDVVRNTFKALHDVIKAQGEAIRTLERQLEQKSSKAETQAQLSRKAAILDINKSLSDMTHALDSKASLYELDNKVDKAELVGLLKTKASAVETKQTFDSKANADDLYAFRDLYEKHMETVASQLDLKADAQLVSKRKPCGV